MEEEKREAQPCAPRYSAPFSPQDAVQMPAPFSATRREAALALFMYLPAYLYLRSSWGDWMLGLFCALFIAMVEWRYSDVPRKWESWVWLGCLLVIALSWPLNRNRVWEEKRILFLHAFAIYWTLSRSGRLLGGESSRFLPLDAVYGVVIYPAKHFFLRIRTLFYALTHLRRAEKKPQPIVLLVIALALGAAVWLLMRAIGGLSEADAAFGAAMERVRNALTPELDILTVGRLLLSLPVGAYLYGLIGGTGREKIADAHARAARTDAALTSLRKVPPALWSAVLAVFAAVYLAFFGLQASYLFGAFTRTLPEGYTLAQYARQGFFSLCRVMAVNFALLWLVTRCGSRRAAENRPVRILSTVLLAQSLLFALIAASKLYLYIEGYGFTPLRLQSAWLIGVLFCGCLCALYALWGGKKAFRFWTLFSGVTLALLHLY